jgi:hypothetical protein
LKYDNHLNPKIQIKNCNEIEICRETLIAQKISEQAEFRIKLIIAALWTTQYAIAFNLKRHCSFRIIWILEIKSENWAYLGNDLSTFSALEKNAKLIWLWVDPENLINMWKAQSEIRKLAEHEVFFLKHCKHLE